MIRSMKRRSGQTMVEYIIIVVVIAIAGLVLFGLFGDVIRKKTTGAISSLDEGLGKDAQDEFNSKNSLDGLKTMDETGL